MLRLSRKRFRGLQMTKTKLLNAPLLRPVSDWNAIDRGSKWADRCIADLKSAAAGVHQIVVGKIAVRVTRKNYMPHRYRVTQCRPTINGLELSGIAIDACGRLRKQETPLGPLSQFEIMEEQ